MTRRYSSKFGSKKLDSFVQIYVWGVALAGIAAAASVITNIPIFTLLAFVIGVSHLFCLIYLGSRIANVQGNSRIDDVQDSYRSYVLTQAGNRIQSAGYLHTLVGFLSAIATVGRTGFDISDLAVPLSGALLTSLLGWLAGGEISSQGEAENPDIERETRKVVVALESYSKRLESIQNGYSKRLEEEYKQRANNILAFQNQLTERLETDHKQRVDSMLSLQEEHITNLEAVHKQHAENTIEFYERCNDELEKIHRKIEKSSTDTSGSLDVFSRAVDQERNKIQLSLQSFCSVIDQQSRDFQTSLQHYRSASTDIVTYSRNVADSIRLLGKNSTKASQDVIDILQAMEAASKNVRSWSEKTGESVSAVNELLVELDKIRAYEVNRRRRTRDEK